MTKKINKLDIIFTVALISGLFFHISTVFFNHHYSDETFYYTIPLRLINGSSLLQHEWHLTQFSSVFTYLPVRIFMALFGLTDGIIIFMRCVYILAHTIVTIAIYRFFKKYGVWAIAAAMIFNTQASYATYAVSYHSVFAVGILFLGLCLLSSVEKKLPSWCIGSGIFFGACCVCNPVFTGAFVAYVAICVLWKGKDKLAERFLQRLTQKNKSWHISDPLCIQPYDNIFSSKAFLFSLTGVGITAIICIIFFFLTGGTIASVFRNAGNIISSSEYEFVRNLFVEKLKALLSAWSVISLRMPFLLPFLFIVLAFDKQRKLFSHKILYISLAFALSCLYAVGILQRETSDGYVFSLPFAFFSTVCYILTEKKNKNMFYCVWCICVIGAFVHGMVSNTLLTSSGVVLSVANVAGVIFVRDLFSEIRTESEKSNQKEKKFSVAVKVLICLILSFQIVFNGVATYCFKHVEKNMVTVKDGPLAGMLLGESRNDKYEKILNDLETIKNHSNKESPVLIISYENWMYLCIDRPFATYTAWNQVRVDTKSLSAYYAQNSDRIPKYIYIPHMEVTRDAEYDHIEDILLSTAELFEFTSEELSAGILLTVTEYKLK